MRVKSLAIVIVINLFLMVFSSVIVEYIDLSERYEAIEENISACMEQAVQTSVKSEEMFSDAYQQKVASYTVSASGTKEDNRGRATVLAFDRSNNRFFDANSYVYSYLYTHDNLPVGMSKSQVDGQQNSWGKQNISNHIFEWLYGDLGSEYGASHLEWANFNRSVLDDLSGGSTSREPNRLFKQFYDEVGCSVTVKGIVKKKTPSSSTSYTTFRVDEVNYPVLTQMGLRLNSYNEVNSSITADNFTSSYHIGRRTARGSNAVTKTRYYLTPASLGVTYVPIEVLTPVFKASLDSLVRLQKVSAGGHVDTNMNAVAASATGCINTDIWSGEGAVNVQHDSDGSDIINDGLNEYDLDSVRVKVEYIPVDIWNQYSDLAKAVVSRSYGLIPSANLGSTATYTDSIAATMNAIKSKDTGRNNVYGAGYTNGQRIVARVTVKMKVHVCYKSKVLQWLCRMFTGGGTNHEHYDVKTFGNKTGIGEKTGYANAYDGDDGTWYEYTTYFLRSR